MTGSRRTAGFSLIELAIGVALVAVVVALAIPSMNDWAVNERLSSTTRNIDAAVSHARSEAIRTGNIHMLYVGTDFGGATLIGPQGTEVDVLVTDDGRAGSPGQNCTIDAGEASLGVALEKDVSFGVANATGKVPTDPGLVAITGATTFGQANGNVAQWLMFRPEGPPLPVNVDCTPGTVGAGGGGIYLNNGKRDKAVVVTPLGSTRIHSWNPSDGVWTS